MPTLCHRGGASLPGLTGGQAVTARVWEVAGSYTASTYGDLNQSPQNPDTQAGAADLQPQFSAGGNQGSLERLAGEARGVARPGISERPCLNTCEVESDWERHLRQPLASTRTCTPMYTCLCTPMNMHTYTVHIYTCNNEVTLTQSWRNTPVIQATCEPEAGGSLV